VIWEASDRICGKRLRPLVPVMFEAMERHGHLQLAPAVRISLLAMSAATIDRSLRDVRRHAGRSSRRKTPPSAAIRRSVPVRTFDGWDNPPPGFVWVLDLETTPPSIPTTPRTAPTQRSSCL